MKSPIEIYKDVLKEFGVEGKLDIHPRLKVAYVETQIQEQQSVLNRLFFDTAIAMVAMNSAKDNLSKDAHRKKVDNYRNDIWQIVEGLKVNLKLAEELRNEYPEAGSGSTK